jgi:hypothetical protein
MASLLANAALRGMRDCREEAHTTHEWLSGSDPTKTHLRPAGTVLQIAETTLPWTWTPCHSVEATPVRYCLAHGDAIAGAFIASKDGAPTARFIWEKLDHSFDRVERGRRRRPTSMAGAPWSSTWTTSVARGSVYSGSADRFGTKRAGP